MCVCGAHTHTWCDGLQVSALNVSNAVVSPTQGKVMHDDNITVACNPGYRIKPPGYQVALLPYTTLIYNATLIYYTALTYYTILGYQAALLPYTALSYYTTLVH